MKGQERRQQKKQIKTAYPSHNNKIHEINIWYSVTKIVVLFDVVAHLNSGNHSTTAEDAAVCYVMV